MTYRKRFPISSLFPSRSSGRWIGKAETDGVEGVKLGSNLPAGVLEQSAKSHPAFGHPPDGFGRERRVA
jgi:hypothetical protein